MRCKNMVKALILPTSKYLRESTQEILRLQAVKEMLMVCTLDSSKMGLDLATEHLNGIMERFSKVHGKMV